jgi:hypothetical protein
MSAYALTATRPLVAWAATVKAPTDERKGAELVAPVLPSRVAHHRERDWGEQLEAATQPLLSRLEQAVEPAANIALGDVAAAHDEAQ